jgi:hypothetical protein
MGLNEEGFNDRPSFFQNGFFYFFGLNHFETLGIGLNLAGQFRPLRLAATRCDWP